MHRSRILLCLLHRILEVAYVHQRVEINCPLCLLSDLFLFLAFVMCHANNFLKLFTLSPGFSLLGRRNELAHKIVMTQRIEPLPSKVFLSSAIRVADPCSSRVARRGRILLCGFSFLELPFACSPKGANTTVPRLSVWTTMKLRISVMITLMNENTIVLGALYNVCTWLDRVCNVLCLET